MEQRTITHRHLAWDIVVFLAVIVSVFSVSIEFALDLSEKEQTQLFALDILVIMVFVADLYILWRNYHGPLREFIYRNWMDVLSAILAL